jgi:hypothetical protein
MCADMHRAAEVRLDRCNRPLAPGTLSREEPVGLALGMTWGNARLPESYTVDELLLEVRKGIVQAAAHVANTDASKTLERRSAEPILAAWAGGVVQPLGGIAEPCVTPEANSAVENVAARDTATGSAERRTEQDWPGAWDKDERSEVTSTGRLGFHASFPGSEHKSVAEAPDGGLLG